MKRFSAVVVTLAISVSGSCAHVAETPRDVLNARDAYIPQTREGNAPLDTQSASNPIVKDIPFEFNANKIYLPVQINGAGPFWFILDSGASFDAIDKERAAALGIETHDGSTVFGAGEKPVEVAVAKVASLRLAGREVAGQSVAVLSLNSLMSFSEGREVDGLLGYEFFSRFAVEIDYARQTVSLYEPGGVGPQGGEVIPLEVDRNHALVKATLTTADGRSVSDRFMLDTGFRTGLTLNAPFVEEHKLLTTTLRQLTATTRVGLGGESRGLVARLGSLRIGSFDIKGVVADFSRDRQGVLSSPFFAGIIGGETLRRFKVVFDYQGRRLMLEPNKHFDDAQEFDMSGLFVTAEGRDLKTFKVHHVIEGSPGFEAGVREGDIIETINDRPASAMTLEQIRQLFKQQEGKEHLLELERGRQHLNVRLRLRRLI